MKKDTVIAGMVMVAFGIGGLVYGISNFGNQFGMLQNCSPALAPSNQSSSQSVPSADCGNNSSRLVIGSVAGVIGGALLAVGSILIFKGTRQKMETS
jgi:hypothetical protein